MRVLPDERLLRRLKKLLADHEVQTVPEAGWSGKKNGELRGLLAARFDPFITTDENMVYQQNAVHLSLGVVVLSARSNRLADLEPLVPRVPDALVSLKPGDLVRVGG